MMKSPTALVTATLVMAILVAASLLIAAGARGANPPQQPKAPYVHSWKMTLAQGVISANPDRPRESH